MRVASRKKLTMSDAEIARVLNLPKSTKIVSIVDPRVAHNETTGAKEVSFWCEIEETQQIEEGRDG